jgi:pyruvate-formate lyase-activating enzyme
MKSAGEKINHLQLYRLPWSLPDNPIVWMEPTSACNFSCDGCYRENLPDSHKPLHDIRLEIERYIELRNMDGISIAGGDPLCHPDIVEIVRQIASRGIKPIINTNGELLTPELLRDLKKAGVCGFTFHVDTTQNRPDSKGNKETDLNPVRLQFAEMIAREGGVSCAFNATIHEGNLSEIPKLLEWAAQHIDIVHLMVFILFRTVSFEEDFDYYAGTTRLKMDLIPYSTTIPCERSLTSHDVVDEIRLFQPEFSPCAYLNGNEDPTSLKWLMAGRIGTPGKIYGYVGPRFMEFAQSYHHLRNGRYLAYSHPSVNKKARSMLFLSPFDPGIRGTALTYLKDAISNPLRLAGRLFYQSVMIIQPVDILEDGRQNMCDSCPDVTLWNNRLVWSCRMEELNMFGCWVQCHPKINRPT